MTKSELSALLHSVYDHVGEGEQFLESAGNYPKVAYWETVWDDSVASGEDYETVVTYQVSHAALRPRDPALVALKRALNEAGLHPTIYHERAQEDGGPAYFHSYMAVDVLEDLT